VTRSLTVTTDPREVSTVAALDALVDAAQFVILTAATLENLAHELGGYGAASGHLLELVERIGHPIGLHVATGPTSSRTVFVGPRSWSSARLKGWIAGHHSELEHQFGEVTRVGRLDR
jgi:hypothetical protein